MNYAHEPIVIEQLIELLKEFKDAFASTYKYLKGIPLNITQQRIELDTIVPLTHQTRYQLILIMSLSSSKT